ncbi:MAG: hypothetical protein J7639_11420 [Paenibacillaceae bacterium]|nr:hypothetical protein [Paenibacillaceae bacterium]
MMEASIGGKQIKATRILMIGILVGLLAVLLWAGQANAAIAADSFDNDTPGEAPNGYVPLGVEGVVSTAQAYSGSKSVHIYDTSATGFSSIVKTARHSAAKRLEFRIYPVSAPYTQTFDISSGGDANTEIVFHLGVHSDGRIKYYDGSVWHYLGAAGTVTVNAWNHIRVEAGNTTSADIYVNGTFIGTAGKWYTFSTMDRVSFKSGSTAGIGDEFYIDDVSFTDPAIEDTFENGTSGSLAPGYTLLASDVAVSTTQAYEGGKSLRINDNNATLSSNAVKVTAPSAAKVLEFSMYPVAAPARNIFYISSGGNSLSDMVFTVGVMSNGSVTYYDGTSWVTAASAGTFAFNTWNKVKLVADNTEAAKLYVGGTLVGTIGKRNAYATMDRFGFSSGSSTGTGDQFYVDNVSFVDYTIAPEPANGIIYEAEMATLSNYTVENVSNARSGKAIKVTAAGTGTATFTFGGTSGYYAINVGYLEVTGANDSTFRVKQNGAEIDYWKGQYDDTVRHIRKVKEYGYVANGDTFVIEGTYGTDPSKVDYLQFTTAIPRTLTRGHLIDDQAGRVGELPSSWLIDTAGGIVDRQNAPDGASSIRLHDTNAAASVSATRRFIEQTGGTITLQFRFRVSAKVDGLKWEIRDGVIPGVKLVTSGGHIAYEDASGTPVTLLSNYAVDTWYGVRIVANIDTDTADIAINGSANSVSGVGFRNVVSKLDNVFVQTTDSGTTTMLVGPVEMVKGYLIFDNFVPYAAGASTPGWTVDNSGGNGNVQSMRSNVVVDILSYKLDDTSGTNSVAISKSFPAQSNKITAELMILIPEKKDGMSVQLLSGSTVGVKLLTADGNISYEDAGGNAVTLWNNYKANVWYDIRIVADASNDRADFYVNKIRKAAQAPFRNNTSNLDTLLTVTSAGNTGVMWVDDFKVFQGTYESQVPAPTEATATSPYTIGVQACDLWREGHHIGYSALRPYDNRMPLYGYFEDGNPEVADWDIKYMVEHGISLYAPCWYRPHNEGYPIKEPIQSLKLHEGFLNAEYIDKIKFSILWENQTATAGVANADDFKTNVLNFWIEHYFKHPSYYKVDNKPVIFIYNSANLNTEVGGNLAAVLDDVRNILISEGFAGAIFIAENRSTTSSSAQAVKDRGFDYQYAYTWYDASISSQQAKLTAQKNNNIIDPIPVLTEGWGDQPWGSATRIKTVPLSDWQSGLSWLRNTFMPGYASGSLGGSLIMLDNWNEINEGHAILPSNIHGFGYLDGIRNVFYSGPNSHTDILPRDAGLGPYDQLTPFMW